MVADDQLESRMEAYLFDDAPPVSAKPSPHVASEGEIEDVAQGIRRLDKVMAVIAILASITLFWSRGMPKAIIALSVLLLTSWIFSNACAVILNGGKSYSGLAIPAHATRWGLPICLGGLMLFKTETARRRIFRLLGFFTFLIFFVHGWEALNLNPPFQDFLYNFLAYFGIEASTPVLSVVLRIIGSMDILLALSIIVYPLRGLFLWMAIWGLVTALSRPIAIGLHAWPEAAMRSANFFLPLMLFIMSKDVLHKIKKDHT